MHLLSFINYWLICLQIFDPSLKKKKKKKTGFNLDAALADGSGTAATEPAPTGPENEVSEAPKEDTPDIDGKLVAGEWLKVIQCITVDLKFIFWFRSLLQYK